MKVLKAPTYYIKKKIEDLTSGNHLIRFSQDADNNWIIGKQVLVDQKFTHIDFSDLVEIDFNPIIVDL